jgi:hypothetical protein
MSLNLKSRIEKLAARLEPAEPGCPPPWMSRADLKRICRSLGSDALRATDDPELREALAPTIAAVEEWEATEPRWWLIPGQGWLHGTRKRGGDGQWQIA